jgi:hypothetical protein
VSARSRREKAAESGKPAEIVAKMVDGAMAKFAQGKRAAVAAVRHGQQDPDRGRRRQAARLPARRSRSRTMSASSSAKASRRKKATSQPKSRRRSRRLI